MTTPCSALALRAPPRATRRHFASALVAAALVLAAGACGGHGGEDDAPVETPVFVPAPIPNKAPVPPKTVLNCPHGSPLDYENFGEGFLLDFCTNCHSAGLTAAQRNGAPAGVDFDSAMDASLWRAAILSSSAGDKPTMPPAQNVPPAERAQLAEWLNCGAPDGASRRP